MSLYWIALLFQCPIKQLLTKYHFFFVQISIEFDDQPFKFAAIYWR